MGTLRSIISHCFYSHLAPKALFLILHLKGNETLELGEKLMDDFEYSSLFALNRILPHMRSVAEVVYYKIKQMNSFQSNFI